MPLSAVSEKLGIPLPTLRAQSSGGRWRQRRDALAHLRAHGGADLVFDPTTGQLNPRQRERDGAEAFVDLTLRDGHSFLSKLREFLIGKEGKSPEVFTGLVVAWKNIVGVMRTAYGLDAQGSRGMLVYNDYRQLLDRAERPVEGSDSPVSPEGEPASVEPSVQGNSPESVPVSSPETVLAPPTEPQSVPTQEPEPQG